MNPDVGSNFDYMSLLEDFLQNDIAKNTDSKQEINGFKAFDKVNSKIMEDDLLLEESVQEGLSSSVFGVFVGCNFEEVSRYVEYLSILKSRANQCKSIGFLDGTDLVGISSNVSKFTQEISLNLVGMYLSNIPNHTDLSLSQNSIVAKTSVLQQYMKDNNLTKLCVYMDRITSNDIAALECLASLNYHIYLLSGSQYNGFQPLLGDMFVGKYFYTVSSHVTERLDVELIQTECYKTEQMVKREALGSLDNTQKSRRVVILKSTFEDFTQMWDEPYCVRTGFELDGMEYVMPTLLGMINGVSPKIKETKKLYKQIFSSADMIFNGDLSKPLCGSFKGIYDFNEDILDAVNTFASNLCEENFKSLILKKYTYLREVTVKFLYRQFISLYKSSILGDETKCVKEGVDLPVKLVLVLLNIPDFLMNKINSLDCNNPTYLANAIFYLKGSSMSELNCLYASLLVFLGVDVVFLNPENNPNLISSSYITPSFISNYNLGPANTNFDYKYSPSIFSKIFHP